MISIFETTGKRVMYITIAKEAKRLFLTFFGVWAGVPFLKLPGVMFSLKAELLASETLALEDGPADFGVERTNGSALVTLPVRLR